MQKIAVVMGSSSDWATMQPAVALLEEFAVPYVTKVLSAHRMPDEMFAFAKEARAAGFGAVIAGAGGAAHLPGMIAANTTLPVIGVPVMSKALHGLDSLLSIVQMPAGVPVATTAIGSAGAKNAALLAIEMLAMTDQTLAEKLVAFRKQQHDQAQESEAKLTRDSD